jgi:uncharacterized membrane protein YhaH (DUF805 family)
MIDYLKDLFSWNGEWTRFKFWVYPLPILIVLLIISSFIAATWFVWYTNESKKLFIITTESNIEQLNEMSELGVPWFGNVLQMQAEVDAMKAEIVKNPYIEPNNSLISILRAVLWILGIAYMYIYIAAYVKRLRDLWKSPWMVLLMLIPIANIYLFIICGFFRG